MYTFRYHLVTICSVFIALALGLLLGAAIASSELAQSTSDDMVEGMLSRYEELVDENINLEQSSTDSQALVGQLTVGWAHERLDGRTIVLMLGTTAEDQVLRSTYTELLSQAGATVVNVTVERPDFGLGEEDILAALESVVPSVKDEEYQQTLAKRLVEEWTYVYTTSSAVSGSEDLELPHHDYTLPSSEAEALSSEFDITGGLEPATAFQTVIYEKYALTRALLSLGVISIEVDYAMLAGHTNPEPGTDQIAAYSIATAWQLPYSVNGLINGFVPEKIDDTQKTRVGIQLTVLMQEAGEDGNLLYPAWLRTSLPKSTSGEVERPSYYALLVQPNNSDTTMESLARVNMLSCVTTPSTPMGRYSVIALLSGAEVGVYGENLSEGYHYAPMSEDTSGRAAFR